MPDLLITTDRGLFCPHGDFHIDPWQPAPRAVITHAHADHARPGCDSYLTTHLGRQVLQNRMGADAAVSSVEYGERIQMGSVEVSLFPAGHILGSAQIKIEHRGEIWVVSGDYKTQFDPTCPSFEPIRCHVFITESTFEKFGPVRSVKPELVFELAFENIQRSTRHKSGIAVRFPRISRWRLDKRPDQADSLETILAMLK